MLATDIVTTKLWQGHDLTMLARVRNATGGYLTQASLSVIVFGVYDLQSATPLAGVGNGVVPISSSVFDALQQNPVLWPVDNIGYNFQYTLTGQTFFALAPRRYRVEIVFIPVTGSKFHLVYHPETQPLLSYV